MNRIPPPLSFRLGLGAPRVRGSLPPYRGPRWLLLPSRSGTAMSGPMAVPPLPFPPGRRGPDGFH